jgi:hypothetical protein
MGSGFYAHRDGYNVLYGDSSVKWYGDPQQRILYWPWVDEQNAVYGSACSLAMNNVVYNEYATQFPNLMPNVNDAGYWIPGFAPASYGYSQNDAPTFWVWRGFDKAAGLDVTLPDFP